MKKRLKILTIIVLSQTVVILILIGLLWNFRDQTNELLSSDVTNYFVKLYKEEEIPEDTQPNVVKAPLNMKVEANLVWWDQDEGFDSIQSNAQYFSSISLFWYELSADGTITPFTGAEDEEILAFLRRNNIKTFAVISNEFNAEPLSSIIADTQKRNDHIQDITSTARIYDGITLNYENLEKKDRTHFTKFTRELAKALHEKKKLLQVNLHAKIDEPGSWNGPMAQDWVELGKVCDGLKIMAYDYHWATSEAGSIAPIQWVDDVLAFAVKQIQKSKVYLGIPLYSYDWTGEQAKDLVFEDVSIILDIFNVKPQFDSESTSKYFAYSDYKDQLHEVWFEDSDTATFKLKIAKKYKVGGVDFWRLGGEDEKVWSNVDKQLSNSK